MAHNKKVIRRKRDITGTTTTAKRIEEEESNMEREKEMRENVQRIWITQEEQSLIRAAVLIFLHLHVSLTLSARPRVHYTNLLLAAASCVCRVCSRQFNNAVATGSCLLLLAKEFLAQRERRHPGQKFI